MNIQMMYIATILLFISITARVSFPQEPIEFLGLNNEKITSLSLYSGVIAVGTDRNGVFWQSESLLTDTSWIHIELDSQSVQTVYAHKSGPVGWAISVGVAPDIVDSAFVYCSFMGGKFIPNSVGIMDSLTDKVSELDGFADPTICGETYAAGGKALYRRGFTGSAWTPVYTTSIEGYIQTVKVKEQYPGVVLAGGAEGFAGFLLIKSTDYGENWSDISPPGTIYSIDFAGESAETIFTAVSEKKSTSLQTVEIVGRQFLMVRVYTISPKFFMIQKLRGSLQQGAIDLTTARLYSYLATTMEVTGNYFL